MDDRQKTGVIVTLDDIWQVVNETKDLVAPLPQMARDHENRLRLLEAFRNKAAGIGASLCVVSGLAGALISHAIK